MSNVELKGLKGLRSLDNLITDSQAPQTTFEKIEKLSIELLVSGKYQPRNYVDETALNELADSIKSQGIIQPLIVRKIESDKFEIIAGERRWRAAKIVGLTHVPTIIREIEDNVALAFALIENIQRENLNPLEEAIAFARFKNEFSMTHDDIARMVGRSRVSVTNTLRLLSLNESMKKLLETGKLNMGHARALLTLDSDLQIKLSSKIIKNQLNVRETEKLVNTIKYPKATKNIKSHAYTEKCEYWSQALSSKFSTKLTVKLNAHGNAIIKIDSPEHIDWIIDNIIVK